MDGGYIVFFFYLVVCAIWKSKNNCLLIIYGFMLSILAWKFDQNMASISSVCVCICMRVFSVSLCVCRCAILTGQYSIQCFSSIFQFFFRCCYCFCCCYRCYVCHDCCLCDCISIIIIILFSLLTHICM